MELALVLLIGLAIGSFLNVCIVRLPLGESVVTPRSRCPQCRKMIGWRDNIPVLSYLILGGRCRNCGRKISIRYPLVEAATAVIAILLYLKFGFGLYWGIYFVFCAALIALALIDVDHRILPDLITINGIWAGLVISTVFIEPNRLTVTVLRLIGLAQIDPHLQSLAGSVIGAIVGGGMLWGVAEAYYRVRGVEGLGFGDVKMMAMVGAFLGAPLALLTIMIGSLAGSVIVLLFMRLTGKTRDYELPFGTFLSFAGVIAVLYGEDIVRFYVTRVIGVS
jgi:leader peptidase (prepilin peptidase) / N-methyltransferase